MFIYSYQYSNTELQLTSKLGTIGDGNVFKKNQYFSYKYFDAKSGGENLAGEAASLHPLHTLIIIVEI